MDDGFLHVAVIGAILIIMGISIGYGIRQPEIDNTMATLAQCAGVLNESENTVKTCVGVLENCAGKLQECRSLLTAYADATDSLLKNCKIGCDQPPDNEWYYRNSETGDICTAVSNCTWRGKQ